MTETQSTTFWILPEFSRFII